MWEDFNYVTVEIKINEKSCSTWCEWCFFTWWKSEIITEIPENIKETFKLIVDKWFKTKIVKIWEDIWLLSDDIDLTIFSGINKMDFSSYLSDEIIDTTKEKLLSILTNKHNKNIFDYVWISYMNQKKIDIEWFADLMDKTIKNSKDILKEIETLNRLQNIYGSNDLNKKNQIEIFDKAFNYFFNYFTWNTSEMIDLNLSKRKGWIWCSGWELINKSELQLEWRYLISNINKPEDTEDTLKKLINSKRVVISLFKSFVMLEHSVETVNDKNLHLDYETFNRLISSEWNFKKLLITHIDKKLEN